MPTRRKVGSDEMDRLTAYEDDGRYAKAYEEAKAELAWHMRRDQIREKIGRGTKESVEQGRQSQAISDVVPRPNKPWGF